MTPQGGAKKKMKRTPERSTCWKHIFSLPDWSLLGLSRRASSSLREKQRARGAFLISWEVFHYRALIKGAKVFASFGSSLGFDDTINTYNDDCNNPFHKRVSFNRVWSTAFCPGTPPWTWSTSNPTRASRPQTPPCRQPPRRPTSTSTLRPAPCPTMTQPTPVSPARERKESAGPLPGARPLS